MKIEHIAIWVEDIERMRTFYLTYFDTVCGEKYVNERKKYTSYFLSFQSGGSRIELMNRPDINHNPSERGQLMGCAHLAISLGNKGKVDALTARLEKDGYRIEGQPRTTGDGYYESVILDPEGNYIELTE